MAFGMRYWILFVVVTCALVADWRLPPESMQPRRSQAMHPSVERHAELAAELRLATESLVRIRWADSLSLLAVTAEGGVLVTGPEDTERPPVEASTTVSDVRLPELFAELEDVVRAHVAEATEGDPAMAFGFVYQSPRHARPETPTPWAGRARIETFAGERDGRAYCLQLHLADPWAEIASRVGRAESGHRWYMRGEQYLGSRESAVGTCRPYLRHGLAGRHVQRWLESGALALAYGSGAPPERIDSFLMDRRLALGVRARDIEPKADRCLAGIPEGCLDVLLDPGWAGPFADVDREVAHRTPAVGVGSQTRLVRWLPDYGYILYDLEEEYGREAFGRFWRSDEEVEVAFREAFGEEMGDWAVRWADATVGVERPSPALPKSASSGALLVMSLLLGLAYVQNRRRNVT